MVRSLADAFGRARTGRPRPGRLRHPPGGDDLPGFEHRPPAAPRAAGRTLQLVARSADGTRSTWAGAGTSWFDDVEIEVLHDRLVRRLAWAERKVELPAGRYEALLPPDATADLMVVLSQALSGRDAEDGRSAFSAPGGGTRLGETLSLAPLPLAQRPGEPRASSAPPSWWPRPRAPTCRSSTTACRSGPPPGSTRVGSEPSSTTGRRRPARARWPPRRATT